MARVPEPSDGDERELLLGWLAFHRDALAAKCADLDDASLAVRSAPPSPMSLLGLVRHLTEMERVYGTWALGPGEELRFVWGEYPDGGPEPDFDAGADAVEVSLAAWRRERASVDERLDGYATLDRVGPGNGRSARWNLLKLSGSTRGTTVTRTCSESGSTGGPGSSAAGRAAQPFIRSRSSAQPRSR